MGNPGECGRLLSLLVVLEIMGSSEGHGCPLSIWAVLETVGGLRGFEQSLSLWMFLVLSLGDRLGPKVYVQSCL